MRGDSAVSDPGAPTPSGHAWIGTSGWTYERWRRDFYANIPRDRCLWWCGAHFTALEINGTHYRLQRRATFEGWRDAVPSDFLFAVKAHRYLTHSRLLTDPVKPIRLERDRAEGLGAALGAVLWQLPARLTWNEARLEAFAAALAAEWPACHTIEFRDASWFRESVAQTLRRYGIAGRVRVCPVAWCPADLCLGIWSRRAWPMGGADPTLAPIGLGRPGLLR